MAERGRLRPHPIAQVHAVAEQAYREAQARLEGLRAELRRLESELAKILSELAAEHGPGYLTVKSVRNSQGRRYQYPVWRTGSRDVYLTGDPRASRALELRRAVYRLRREIALVKRLARYAWVEMQASKEYRGTCIEEDTGEYVKCPEG